MHHARAHKWNFVSVCTVLVCCMGPLLLPASLVPTLGKNLPLPPPRPKCDPFPCVWILQKPGQASLPLFSLSPPSLLFFMRVSSFILLLFLFLHSTVPHGQPSTPPEIQEGGGGEVGGGLGRAAPFGPPRMVFLAFLAILTISTGMFLGGEGIVPLNHSSTPKIEMSGIE